MFLLEGIRFKKHNPLQSAQNPKQVFECVGAYLYLGIVTTMLGEKINIMS